MPIHSLMRLKANLKLHLERLDLTAAQLSGKSSVSKQTLSYWLGGGEPRKINHVKKVADALNTTVDELCFADGLQEKVSPRADISSLLGDDWVGGTFELKIRTRVKR